ncbi:hypothetical protein DFH09DRAFT_1102534 [Mycena vulgaris]|nr:hypothetical protein DFH09DRAFT_1102534 [Mycena vulgaris]
MDPEEIDILLNLPRDSSRLVLRGLHSFFHVPSAAGTPFGPRSELLHALPTLLADAIPSEDLIQLLRNEDFQDSIFISSGEEFSGIWPQRDSLYPPDLIRLWEDHRFISHLTANLGPTSYQSSPTFKLDSTYFYILFRHPDTLFVLQTLTVASNKLFTILRFLGPAYTYRVFKPFLEFAHLLVLPLPAGGDSPIDFLRDPRRAMEPYSSPEDIAQALVLLGIRRTKEVLSGGDFYLAGGLWEFIKQCRPSSQILRELETLDLSEFCTQLSPDAEAHVDYAEYDPISPDIFLYVLEWLRRFSDPPPENHCILGGPISQDTAVQLLWLQPWRIISIYGRILTFCTAHWREKKHLMASLQFKDASPGVLLFSVSQPEWKWENLENVLERSQTVVSPV